MKQQTEIYLLTGIHPDKHIGLLQLKVLHKDIYKYSNKHFTQAPDICKENSLEGKNAIESLPMQALLLGTKHFYHVSGEVREVLAAR